MTIVYRAFPIFPKRTLVDRDTGWNLSASSFLSFPFLLSNPKDLSKEDAVFHILGPIYGSKTLPTLDHFTTGWNGRSLGCPQTHRERKFTR